VLRLPGRIQARLQDISGAELRTADVLIGINTFRNGKYYYGNLLGLTDPMGRVELPRHELELRFAADRVAFPSDFTTDLETSDERVEIVLLTAAELEQARESIAQDRAISQDIRAAYEMARNAEYTPAGAVVWADLPRTALLVVTLTTGRVSAL